MPVCLPANFSASFILGSKDIAPCGDYHVTCTENSPFNYELVGKLSYLVTHLQMSVDDPSKSRRSVVVSPALDTIIPSTDIDELALFFVLNPDFLFSTFFCQNKTFD